MFNIFVNFLRKPELTCCFFFFFERDRETKEVEIGDEDMV